MLEDIQGASWTGVRESIGLSSGIWVPHTVSPEHQAWYHLEREPPRVAMWRTEMSVRAYERQHGPGPQKGSGQGPPVCGRL